MDLTSASAIVTAALEASPFRIGFIPLSSCNKRRAGQKTDLPPCHAR
jgi:hypothetical protein